MSASLLFASWLRLSLITSFIVLTPIALFRIRANYRKGKLSKAKDYIVIIILTLMISIAFYVWLNQAATTLRSTIMCNKEKRHTTKKTMSILHLLARICYSYNSIIQNLPYFYIPFPCA
jgi:hypothetical protein